MIEETNRPNLIIYNDYQIVNGKHEKYFVITNIGNVPAMITNLEFDKPLDELNNNRFDKNLVNTVVVPGQVLKSIILNSYYETLQATLTYKRVTSKPYHHKDECYKKQSHKEDKYIYKTILKTDMSKYLFYTVHRK
ncbi:TPA: hypothetical protein TX926_000583 [Streptococcus suis]|nr:hypothetical protein [Streptococcus suis]